MNTDPLAAVRSAVLAGLPDDEALVLAVGLRPVATVDPTAETRKELFDATKRAPSLPGRAAGLLFRVNDRWNALTDPGYSHDEPSRADVQRARSSAHGTAGSSAVQLLRCWLDVPRDSVFLYLSDRRWLITSTVAAAADRPAAPSDRVKGFGQAARELGRIFTGSDDPVAGLPERTAQGTPALLVAWSAPCRDVAASRAADGLRLAFPDGSWVVLRPVDGAGLEDRIAQLEAAGVSVAS